MGLHITSVAEVADKAGGIQGLRYFVYFLNYYQFSDEVVDAFIEEMPALEAHFSKIGNAVLISSIKNQDFYSDVLNWHNVTGLDPEEICPCLFICTIPPDVIRDHSPNDGPLQINDRQPWAILKIGELCSTASDLRELMKHVVAAIAKNEDIENFSDVETYLYQDRPILSGKIEWNGIQFDAAALWTRLKRKISKRRRPLEPNYDLLDADDD